MIVVVVKVFWHSFFEDVAIEIQYGSITTYEVDVTSI